MAQLHTPWTVATAWDAATSTDPTLFVVDRRAGRIRQLKLVDGMCQRSGDRARSIDRFVSHMHMSCHVCVVCFVFAPVSTGSISTWMGLASTESQPDAGPRSSVAIPSVVDMCAEPKRAGCYYIAADSSIRYYDASTDQLHPMIGHYDVSAVAVSSNGNRLVSGSSNTDAGRYHNESDFTQIVACIQSRCRSEGQTNRV